MLPNDGVRLARMEFIISEHIGIHPMALAAPDKVASSKARAAIVRLTRRYAHPTDFFVEKLSEGVGTIAAAFYPKPVIIRLSDFKTNEYARLIGGAGFEPREANPMLGFRGAARYTHPAYAASFALECAALRRVRDVTGLTNLVRIPCASANPATSAVDVSRRTRMAGSRRAAVSLARSLLKQTRPQATPGDATSAVATGSAGSTKRET